MEIWLSIIKQVYNMERFSDFFTAFAVARRGENKLYEPWLLSGKDGVWLKPLDSDSGEDFVPMEGELSDYIGFTKEECSILK